MLENRYPQRVAEEPELLAYHWTEAGFSPKAVAYWKRAAEQALQRSAYQERLAHLESALRLLDHNPEMEQRQACELELQISRGGTVLEQYRVLDPAGNELLSQARDFAISESPLQVYLVAGETLYVAERN